MTPPASASAPISARQLVRPLPLFGDLPEGDFDYLLGGARELTLDNGESLFRQGDEARRFYVLREGRIALLRQSEDGDEKIITVLQPVETFAEGLSFLPRAEHDMAARALGRTALIAFDSDRLRNLLCRSSDLCFKVMAALRQRERFLLEEIDQLALQSASQRLVAYLLAQLGSEDGPARLRLEYSKQLLASQLAMKPETLSRILGDLKGSGLLREEADGALAVPDPTRLRQEYRCFLCGNRRWGCPGPAPGEE